MKWFQINQNSETYENNLNKKMDSNLWSEIDIKSLLQPSYYSDQMIIKE